MGRVSRKRKIKAIDPFSKTGGVVPDKVERNLAPTKAQLEMVPKRAQREGDTIAKIMAKMQQKAAEKREAKRARMNPPSKDTKKSKKEEKEEAKARAMDTDMQPGESVKAYIKRINKMTREKLHDHRTKGYRKASDKRKQYLEKKKEAKKLTSASKATRAVAKSARALGPGAGWDSDGEDISGRKALTDVISFGERVERPPTLSVLPRYASKITKDKNVDKVGVSSRGDEFAKAQMEELKNRALSQYKQHKRAMREKSSGDSHHL